MSIIQIVAMLSNVSFPFQKEIVSLFLWIDSIGYRLFSIFYKTFIKLAQQEMFKMNAFEKLYDSIYIIFGVVALFLVAYMILKMIINPELEKGSKEIKDMIFRFILSMMLICLLPTMFDFLKDFQNALLEYNVVPKILLNNEIILNYEDEFGNQVGESEFINAEDYNLTTEVMETRANQMVAIIINGLMYPLNSSDDDYDGEPAEKVWYEDPDGNGGYYKYLKSDGKEWTTDVTEWWDSSAKGWTVGIGCALGATGALIITIATSGIGSFSFGLAAVACGGAGLVAYGGGELIAAVNAKEYTWTNALQAITTKGDFSQITLFAKAIVDGEFHYTMILSTIVVGVLVWLMINFCFDVVVRTAKLLFYQLLAPLCFLLSCLPKKRDLLTNWLKLVLTTWFEIFIRVGCICAVVLLVGALDLDNLTSFFHPIISTFVILGLVIFAKQIPKLLKEVTGIDSGNMKLGIRDKLKEGSFGLSSAAGTLARKTIAGIDAKRNGYNFKDGWRSIEGTGPLSKLKKGFYGMLPYTAKSIEKSRSASEQAKEIETKVKTGKELIAKYGGSGEYIEQLEGQQYAILKEAYKNRKDSKALMLSYQAELEAARASGDVEWISAASKNYNEAKDKYDSYDNEFKQMLNSQKFSKVGKNYADMKYVEDREKVIPSVEEYRNRNNNGYQATRNNNSTTYSNNIRYVNEFEYDSNSTEPTIIIPSSVQSRISEKRNIVESTPNEQNIQNPPPQENNPLSELENLNRQKREIETQIKNERNPKYIQEANEELNEINRKINDLNKKGEN